MTFFRLIAAALVFSLAAPAGSAWAAESRLRKKAKKKAGYDYDRSKYKSRDLAEDAEHSYKFDERGKPILPKKKAAKKKRSEPPEAVEKAPETCGLEESCAPAKTPSEADSL